jgi:hypothetical protein
VSFASSLLPGLDRLRTIPGSLGLRPYSVSLLVTTWTGDTTGIGIGRGTKTDTLTPITLAGGQPPKIRRLSYKETVAGGGKYQEGDFKIGPLTPDYVGGGVPFSVMAPTRTGDARTGYHFVLYGPDTPAEGLLCEPVEEQADRALHRYLVVRPTGSTP